MSGPPTDSGATGAGDAGAAALTAEAEAIAADGTAAVRGATTSEDLASLDADLLGKRSRFTSLKASLRDLSPEGRREAGAALQQARALVEAAVEERRAALVAAERDARLDAERMDLTEHLGKASTGHLHPITHTWERLEDVFVGMGFSVADGPEVETDWFNFEALNLPPSHPARSLWDTLYLDPGGLADTAGAPLSDEQLLLRTHTSPVQVRTMLRSVRTGSGPPIYVVCPGRVYRRDTADATHLPVFHQIEGLVVDRGISMAHLAGTIETFTHAYFGGSVTSRLRPSYFPFTEPSAEFDISTPDGGWLELGGCGMVHPNVLRSGGLDPEEWSGFAFGFGIDRLAKVRHRVGDLRDFITNDVRFLGQFTEA
jgi:phenylalanyl-tRNA synthetase alpha chain